MSGLIVAGILAAACAMSANKGAGGFFGALIVIPLIVMAALAALKALGVALP